MLFAEIGHRVVYGVHIYGNKLGVIEGRHMFNLFHPSTVPQSFILDTYKKVGGLKKLNENGNPIWNLDPHPDRVIDITDKELLIFAKAFEDNEKWQEVKLVSVHAKQIIFVIKKLSEFKGRVGETNYITSECWHETNAQNDGYIKRQTKFVNYDNYELIYSGPHFFVGQPYYKNPRESCVEKADYDVIDLTRISEDFVPRTNYLPAIDLVDFATQAGSGELPWGGRWIDSYRMAFRQMVNSSSERTLSGAILPPKTSQINTVISTSFANESDLLVSSGTSFTISCDFFTKTRGKGHVHTEDIEQLPLISGSSRGKIIALTLRLNCLTRPYVDLWERNWKSEYSEYTWSIAGDARLSPHSACTPTWTRTSALRNPFERRMALVELDVLVAKALGLTLEELILIYQVQFPVLQQNELDTYYDQKGNIVWTCSKGLTGVGLHKRSAWDAVKDMKAGEGPLKHTIDPKYSELYGGEEREFWPPFEKRSREEDYGEIWGKIDFQETT